MIIYCDNAECEYCNTDYEEKEDYKCTYHGVMMSFSKAFQPDQEIGLLYCDNFKPKK